MVINLQEVEVPQKIMVPSRRIHERSRRIEITLIDKTW
jgi:hypothetical protein